MGRVDSGEPGRGHRLPKPRRVAVVDARPREVVDPDPAGRQRIAVVVCHGMGQQVRFETIDSVARLIGLAAEAKDHDVSEIKTRFATLSGIKTARAELTIGGQQPQEVHVYEAYWAPLTEGVVRLRDVVVFLFRAAWNGLRGHGLSRRGPGLPLSFERYIFNGVCSFDVSPRTVPALLAASVLAGMLILFALGVVWAVGGFVLSRGDDVAFWRDVLQDWAKDVSLFLIPLVITSIVLWWRSAHLRRTCIENLQDEGARDALKKKIKKKIRNEEAAQGHHWQIGIVVLLALTAFMLLVTDALGVLHLLARAGRLPDSWSSAVLNWPVQWHVSAIVQLPIWCLAVVLAFVVRWFVVQFVGDVAGYVSAPWLDRFNKLRHDIQDACCGITRAVYKCKEYDRVVLVGHSLGSVIAYDVLNRLVNEDLVGTTRDVICRTSALLTFGSPLDKTAFVFRTHTRPEQYVREALAASVQPLIVSYDYRPPLWLNIWSRSDIISGSLGYYDADVPGGGGESDVAKEIELSGKRVQNLRDYEADLPLIAHIQYWNNPVLAVSLLRAVEQAIPGGPTSVTEPPDESRVLAV